MTTPPDGPSTEPASDDPGALSSPARSLSPEPAGPRLPPPGISLLVAAARNGVIGRANQLPWRLPDDLRRFKQLTMGHPIVMGRKTFESIGRPLPGRTNIVVSRQAAYEAPGAIVAHSLDEALDRAAAGEVFVIGGEAIFAAALPHASRVYLTRVEADVDGDVYFPPLDPAQWHEVSSESHDADGRHAHAFRFVVCDRIRTVGRGN